MRAMFCDMYNFQITGDVSCNLNASSCNSPTHSGPSLLIVNDQGGDIMLFSKDITPTLRAQDHGHPPVVCFEPGIARREGSDSRFVHNTSVTLRARMGDNQPAVCYAVDSHPMDSRFRVSGEVSGTVTTKLAKGSADGPLVIVENE